MIRRRAAIVLLPRLIDACERVRVAGIEALVAIGAFEVAARRALTEVLVEDAQAAPGAREEGPWQ